MKKNSFHISYSADTQSVSKSCGFPRLGINGSDGDALRLYEIYIRLE